MTTSDPAAGDAIGLHYDSRRSKLCGWAAPFAAERASEPLILSLMAGDMLLGTLRRDVERPDVAGHLGYAGPPTGFSVPDFGLAAFARMTGLAGLAIAVGGSGGSASRHPVPLGEDTVSAEPLGTRRSIASLPRLADAWLDSSRDLVLRFEGAEQVAASVSAFQCTPGKDPLPVCLAADAVIGGLVSIATIKLFNPFVPLLLLFKGSDGHIAALDLIPFPSLLRGGLHEAERLIQGDGSDSVADCAAVSAALLDSSLSPQEHPRLATITLDPALHTGLEPILNDELLAWLGDGLGIEVGFADQDRHRAPDFIAEQVERRRVVARSPGHRLVLPADCVPTIAALVTALASGAEPAPVHGAMAVAQFGRHARIWSVVQPRLGQWLDALQGAQRPLAAPMLDLAAGQGEAPDHALAWPLAIAFCEKPTRVEAQGPFEIAAEIAPPLLRDPAPPAAAGLSALILCDRSDAKLVGLLESLARQAGVGPIDVTVSRPTAKPDAALSAALEALFPGRHRVVPQPAGMGRLERLHALGGDLPDGTVVVLDAATLLPDPRTLATMLPMLVDQVASVGCMVRSASGKFEVLNAGFAPVGFDLRGVPALSFAPIDVDALRGAGTVAVAANSGALLLTRASLLRNASPRGSSALRPEADDVLLGLQGIDGGLLNLCTTLVSAYSHRAAPRATDLALSVPHRLSMETISRVMNAATIVQAIR